MDHEPAPNPGLYRVGSHWGITIVHDPEHGENAGDLVGIATSEEWAQRTVEALNATASDPAAAYARMSFALGQMTADLVTGGHAAMMISRQDVARLLLSIGYGATYDQARREVLGAAVERQRAGLPIIDDRVGQLLGAEHGELPEHSIVTDSQQRDFRRQDIVGNPARWQQVDAPSRFTWQSLLQFHGPVRVQRVGRGGS